ncbi:hypothetical protein [Acetobacter sp. DsW_063]|nr:hypothetical protein [Acetobacter sp. DsW_063]
MTLLKQLGLVGDGIKPALNCLMLGASVMGVACILAFSWWV